MYYVKLSIKSDELRQRVSHKFLHTDETRNYEIKKKKKNRRSRAQICWSIAYASRIIGIDISKKLACHINRTFVFDREQKHSDRVSKETQFQVEGYARDTSEIME